MVTPAKSPKYWIGLNGASRRMTNPAVATSEANRMAGP
jgi:hypothetical protein